jgi:uncharacterized LabA/DUF88 family protein
MPAKMVNVYIDGFNLYHAIDNIGDNSLKWINLRTLAQSFIGAGEVLNQVVFYTAVLEWNQSKRERHLTYIAALEANEVKVVKSNFKKVKKHCRVMDRYCSNHEEKQTDVAIALGVVTDVFTSDVSKIVMITADSDQIPTIKAVLQFRPEVYIVLATPPGRETQARELGQLVHERRPITAGRLRTCKLPRNVTNSSGKTVAIMPASYAD